MSDNGENVLNALRVIEALGSELEALKDELEAMLLHTGAEAGVTFEGEDNAPDDNAYNDASGWVLTGWRWTYPAKERRTGAGRRRAVGGLTIVADIGRSGGLAEALGFPCLLVAWSNRLDDWEYVFDEGGGTRDKQRAEAFWPRNDQEEWLRADRLFWWLRSLGEGEGPDVAEKSRAKMPIEAAWFYALPLTAVSSPAMLRSLVLDPVLVLLRGGPVADAFTGAPEALRFRWEDGLSVPLPS